MKLQDLKILKVKIETTIDSKEKNKSLMWLLLISITFFIVFIYFFYIK